MDHNIVILKLRRFGVHEVLLEWITSFLHERKQHVKIGNTKSEYTSLKGGVPQGTKLGPLLFLCMIDDLQMEPPVQVLKFVDDTTLLEVAPKNVDDTHLQDALDLFQNWTLDNNMMLNPQKTKELCFCFSNKPQLRSPLHLNGLPIQSVKSAKLLGVTLSSDLKWDLHVQSIVKKASQRLYILTILKRCCAPKDHLLHVFKSIVRPVLEYATQCWHPGLTKAQCELIELIQKRAMRIICPGLCYTEALNQCHLITLHERRHVICKNYFDKMQLSSHKLNSLLPSPRDNTYQLLKQTKYELPRLRTKRARHSFINWALYNLQ